MRRRVPRIEARRQRASPAAIQCEVERMPGRRVGRKVERAEERRALALVVARKAADRVWKSVLDEHLSQARNRIGGNADSLEACRIDVVERAKVAPIVVV